MDFPIDHLLQQASPSPPDTATLPVPRTSMAIPDYNHLQESLHTAQLAPPNMVPLGQRVSLEH